MTITAVKFEVMRATPAAKQSLCNLLSLCHTRLCHSGVASWTNSSIQDVMFSTSYLELRAGVSSNSNTEAK